MPYEYLASVQSAVRRVNERIKTLSERFGSDSAIVNEATAKIDVFLRDNYRFKDGIPQVILPSDIYGDYEKEQALKELEGSIKTWGQYKKSYEEPYKQYKEEQKFFNVPDDKIPSMGDYIKTMENLSNALRELASEQLPDEALEILQTKNRRNTYQELSKVVDILFNKGLI